MDAPAPALTVITLAAVNVAQPAPIARAGDEIVLSAIAKAPLPPGTTWWLSELNIEGDAQADLTVHGGPDKAVYAYASEHLPAWADELGEELDDLGPAPFGENLSTVGADEATVRIGDVWRWGDARLEVVQPRRPCFKLALHRHRADIQHLFTASGRSGWYLRVLTPGAVPVDGPITVESQHPAGITVADANRAYADRRLQDPEQVRAVAFHDRLAAEWREPLLRRL